MNNRLSHLFGYFAQSALSLYFFREVVSRGFTRLSWIALDFWISLLSLSLSLFAFREVEKESKSSFSRMRMQYFSSFSSLSLSKTDLKTFIFPKTNHVGARVVRHWRKVGREVRRGHEGCHRASSRSFGLPDGRRRERTVHRKDESVDERVGREVQKIWGLFR